MRGVGRRYRLQVEAVKVLETLEVADGGDTLPVQADGLQVGQGVEAVRRGDGMCHSCDLPQAGVAAE